VFGHKPTWGIVPVRGHIPGPPGQRAPTDLAVVGPLARSAEDLRLALDLIAGPPLDDVASGWRLELPSPRSRRLGELRIAAWFDDSFSPVDTEYRGLLEACADALEREGARVDRKARPSLDFAASFETYAMLLHPVIASTFPAPLIDALAAASTQISAEDRSHRALQVRGALASHLEWIAFDEKRHRLADVWARFFRDFDLLLLPVHPTAAFPHDHDPDLHARTLLVNGAKRPYLDFLHWSHLATLVGLPVTVAPIGRTADGLPVGVQVVGERFQDHTTIEGAGLIAELSGGFSPPPGY
jgi:amidase